MEAGEGDCFGFESPQREKRPLAETQDEGIVFKGWVCVFFPSGEAFLFDNLKGDKGGTTQGKDAFPA